MILVASPGRMLVRRGLLANRLRIELPIETPLRYRDDLQLLGIEDLRLVYPMHWRAAYYAYRRKHLRTASVNAATSTSFE
jgi:hypothetical protein